MLLHSVFGAIASAAPFPPQPPDNANCFVESGADTVVVTTMANLEAQVNAAPPGRQILIAPGTYTGGTRTFTRSGTQASPIVVRPQNGIGTVTINSPAWTIANASDWLVFEKLYFSGGRIILLGDHNRISRCRFRDFTGEAVRMETTRDCRIDHCDFVASGAAASCITYRGGGTYGAGTAARNRIDYCYFHDHASQAIDGFSDTALLGNNVATGESVTVDHCLFQNLTVNGEFVILKVGGMIWSFNTFDNISGYFQTRTGAHYQIRSNWFEGLGATDIHIWSEDNLFIGNRIVGNTNVWVPIGNGSWVDQQSGAVPTNRYEPATNSRFIGNRFGSGRLQLGQAWTMSPAATLPANNNLLEANTRDSGGNAHEQINSPVNPGATNTTINATTSEPFVAAVKLTAADVGLAAADPYCPSGPQS